MFEGLKLLITPDKGNGEAIRLPITRPLPIQAQARGAVDGQGLAHALHLDLAQRLPDEQILGQVISVLADQHRTRFGGRLHPRRESDGLAHRGFLAVAAAIPHAGDNHLTRVHPHPQLQVNVLVLGQTGGVAGERLLHGERGQHRSLRVILVGRGRAEESHQAIAPELIHDAAEAIDLRLQDLEDAIHDLHPRLGANLLQEVCRALYVR